MKYTSVDGQLFKEMLLNGAKELENNKVAVNALNVFPVPDGDTGTNMSATMMAAAAEIKKVKDINVHSVGDAASMGSLMGARGNSGVILSQILRGISKQLKDKKSISTMDFGLALKEGVSVAYRAVMRPTEGTILTVARESAEAACEIAKTEKDFAVFMRKVYDQASETLDRTPNMLPVLKQAGVVDAGGKGLLCIYLGILKTLEGIAVLDSPEIEEDKEDKNVSYENIETGDIKFGYCTEFFIKTKNGDPDKFKNEIVDLGDSMVVVGTENLIKVHIHTNEPGTVLNKAMTHGELSKIKIDNMREQHRSIIDENDQEKTEEPVNENSIVDNETEKDYGVITVAMGDGITSIFKNLGVDVVIEGGQTMNPSTQDILEAINSINAKKIFVMPNNGNIIMAAQQARDISGKDVSVIPTKSIPQGITAVITLNPDLSSDVNEKEMNEAILRVKSGQVTYAVRDTVFNDVEIKEGNVLGICNGKLIKAGENLDSIVENLIDTMVDEESQLITILFGNGLKEEDTSSIENYIADKYPDCEVSITYGGQPLYYYIISVE